MDFCHQPFVGGEVTPSVPLESAVGEDTGSSMPPVGIFKSVSVTSKGVPLDAPSGTADVVDEAIADTQRFEDVFGGADIVLDGMDVEVDASAPEESQVAVTAEIPIGEPSAPMVFTPSADKGIASTSVTEVSRSVTVLPDERSMHEASHFQTPSARTGHVSASPGSSSVSALSARSRGSLDADDQSLVDSFLLAHTALIPPCASLPRLFRESASRNLLQMLLLVRLVDVDALP